MTTLKELQAISEIVNPEKAFNEYLHLKSHGVSLPNMLEEFRFNESFFEDFPLVISSGEES